jgi:acyl carrier protein
MNTKWKGSFNVDAMTAMCGLDRFLKGETMNELKSRVRAFILENFLFGEGDALRDDASFLDEGLLDSTGVLELLAFLENEFKIRVADDELLPENLDSVDKVAAYVQIKTGAAVYVN